MQAQSASYNSGNFAKILIDNKEVKCERNEHSNLRGLHVVVISPKDGSVKWAKVFDTHKTSYIFDAFIS